MQPGVMVTGASKCWNRVEMSYIGDIELISLLQTGRL